VAGHQRDATRIASKIDRRQIRVGSHDSNVKWIDAENFRNDISKDRIRTLSDVSRSTHHADAALAIQPELHTRLRHVVPIDRQTGATDIRTARDPNPFTKRQLALVPRKAFTPARTFGNFLDAFPQSHAADPQVVRRHRIRRDEMLAPDLNRIHSQLLGDLVELNFQRVAWLWRAVPALRTTRRLVCESSQSLKLVTRHFIRDGLQRARVERTRDTVAAVRTTVEK